MLNISAKMSNIVLAIFLAAAGCSQSGSWQDASANPEFADPSGVTVRVESVEVGHAQIHHENMPAADRPSEETYTIVKVSIRNGHESKILRYIGWSGWPPADDAAFLSDDVGNKYRENGIPSYGIIESASIRPGESVTDTLVFEPPVDKASTLYLELRAANADLSQDVRFSIPAAMFRSGK